MPPAEKNADESQTDRQHRHQRAEADPAEQPRPEPAGLRVPAHAVPRVLIEEVAHDNRRHEEPYDFVSAIAQNEPARAAPPRHHVGDPDRDAEPDRGVENDPRQRDSNALHICKRNARHQRRARIVGVSLVRTGTRITSFSRSPSRNGHVPSCAAADTLPVRMASCARPPRWMSTRPTKTPKATRVHRRPVSSPPDPLSTLQRGGTIAPAAYAAIGY